MTFLRSPAWKTACGLAFLCVTATQLPALAAAAPEAPNAGALEIVGPAGDEALVCPLSRTSVEASISGFVARTTVRQVFRNPLQRKIEAVYVFPLPDNAAVDDMVMTVGDRRIVGSIRERDEARQIYENARAAGHVAGLLDQERPNIFTQSVANIEPGVEVVIEIRYVETLSYDEGVFQWVFPMVVGPRYIPGGGSAQAPLTSGQPTRQVPDGDRITPPVVPEGLRAGHDVSIAVRIEAGTELFDLESVLHEVELDRRGKTEARVALADRETIPNRDFILRYRLATDRIGNAFFTHHDARGDWFTLILQPPRRVEPKLRVARELIFVLDTSGSMRGFPMDTAKQLMSRMIDTMDGADTFNMITFAGDTHVLWDRPRSNTGSNRAEAQQFLAGQRGGGGTEMMQAIHAALNQQDQGEAGRMRIVCFMTDGYVGNDVAIIDAVRRNAETTRVFSFGIGNSVNRFLLNGMAHAGRGEVEYVTLKGGTESVERFHERVLAPVLTDIEIGWGDLPVDDVYPRMIPDLFSAKPILVHGRLTGPAVGTIRVRGTTGAGLFEKSIDVGKLNRVASGETLPSLWARAKVEDLMNLGGTASPRAGQLADDVKQQVTRLGLDYRLMTQFTSFVAVEELYVTVGGTSTRIEVPVEMPDGVSYDGVFGDKKRLSMAQAAPAFVAGSTAARSKPKSGVMRKMHMPLLPPSPSAIREEQVAAEPVTKLDASLQGLAERVATRGQDGDLTLDGIEVLDHEVQVMVFLSDLSPETMQALTRVGFVATTDSKVARVLVGRIDVRRLEALAELDSVVSIRPILLRK